MANKKTRSRARKVVSKPTAKEALAPPATHAGPLFALQLSSATLSKGAKNPAPMTPDELDKRLEDLHIRATVDKKKLLAAINRINPIAAAPIAKLPDEIQKSIPALSPPAKRFHGTKVALSWFPFPWLFSPCADKFGYMSSAAIRNATKLPFTLANQILLGQLGDMMGNPGRETAMTESTIPAGFTYVGQFVDHDITFDVSSSLDVATDANTVNNMRSPSLDLDSLYGRGPALDPYRYVFPTVGPPTAIKFLLGSNQPAGPGGPAGSNNPADMQQQTDFDVPRVSPTNTAVIGDPRNDENLIVSQFHHAMLRFHNAVVDVLVAVGFAGDIFVEAKKQVTHHYQWAVVNDFLRRLCTKPIVDAALAIPVALKSPFRMPVEFAVAAYRFGHSMIRDDYFVNFNFPDASLAQVFQFIRNPLIPVLSNWVVDFNAFFETGVTGAPFEFNMARKIDSVMANGLESLPGFPPGLMAILATRNLRRGLALGLPSGQGMATHFGVAKLTPAQLKSGLPANEVALLDSNGGILLKKTPLWYYVLREAAVVGGGNRLGPVGARIVAQTFARMLKRDPSSYVNLSGGFTPFLPSKVAGNFTFTDLVTFAGVTNP